MTDPLGDWEDVLGKSDRVNGLQRQNWALVDEVVRLANDGHPYQDDIADLLDASLDIEEKYLPLRTDETARAIEGRYQ